MIRFQSVVQVHDVGLPVAGLLVMEQKMKTVIGYNVYRAQDGSSPSYYGFAATLEEAKQLASKGRSLEESLWDTARTAGHCAGISAPDQSHEDEEPAAWFGEDGYDCAVAVFEG